MWKKCSYFPCSPYFTFYLFFEVEWSKKDNATRYPWKSMITTSKIKKMEFFTLELQTCHFPTTRETLEQTKSLYPTCELQDDEQQVDRSLSSTIYIFLQWWEKQFNSNILLAVKALDCFIWCFMNKLMEYHRGYKRVPNWLENTFLIMITGHHCTRNP